MLTIVCVLPVWAGLDDDWRNLYSLASNAVALKDYPKADALYSKALQDAELFGKADLRVATTLRGQASLQHSEKRLTEAEDTARRALGILITNPGQDSIEYGQGQFTLAGILLDEGKYQPALDAIRKA